MLSSNAGTCVGRRGLRCPMEGIRRKPNPPHRRGAQTLQLRISAAAPRVERSREQCNLRVAREDFGSCVAAAAVDNNNSPRPPSLLSVRAILGASLNVIRILGYAVDHFGIP
jgi:hypothetical protein